MSDTKHYETAPEDRIPFRLKLVYGLGAFVNNLLAAAIGGMVIVLNLGLGMNPALVGLVAFAEWKDVDVSKLIIGSVLVVAGGALVANA